MPCATRSSTCHPSMGNRLVDSEKMSSRVLFNGGATGLSCIRDDSELEPPMMHSRSGPFAEMPAR